jgi:FixJ family two-component response regulator
MATNARMDHWQQSFELGDTSGGQIGRTANDAVTLVARGAELPDNQRLLVFDDISEIVSAQRAQAWGEVARRLAHEIKNPLTPIQLSAERLEKKLTGKVATAEQALLTKSVKTIVDQVDAMKRLVNEFRDYARLPAAELSAIDLNTLAQDVLAMYASEKLSDMFVSDLDPCCPPVMGDPQQLRQVLHNLLQNALDATVSAGRADSRHPVILKTEWRSATMANILVVDDELGIRDLLSEILNDEGHTVELAENAAQARAARQGARPDLVLLDIWMPDTDGVTLLKEWRGTGLLTMPVIMMSGHATIDTAVEATRIGAQSFLEKPITLQKLLKAVDQALARDVPQRKSPADGLEINAPAPMSPVAELTVESAMMGGQTLPTAVDLSPQASRRLIWTNRCAMRAMRSKSVFRVSPGQGRRLHDAGSGKDRPGAHTPVSQAQTVGRRFVARKTKHKLPAWRLRAN